MNRLNKIRVSLGSFRDMWIEKKVKICREQPESSLLKQAEQLLFKVKEGQVQGIGRSLCYISLFHFRSSLYTETNRYQICASDEMLYLNPPLASEYWVPEYIYNDVTVLQSLVETELRKHFVRLLPFEIDFAVKVLLEDYQKLVDVYWLQAAEKIIAGEVFKSIRKQDDWKILSGTYMDDMKIILQSENRR